VVLGHLACGLVRECVVTQWDYVVCIVVDVRETLIKFSLLHSSIG
jgi:hypothetical protein